MTGFRLNGTDVEVPDDRAHLLAALREELGVISPKDGCAPSGQCGCCTVLLDGKARGGLPDLAGEGRGPGGHHARGHRRASDRYADAFAAAGALQCGFCTPGILVRAKALLDKKGAELTREKAARHLGAHLCRCTGYVKILDAVETLARGESPTPVARRRRRARGGQATRAARWRSATARTSTTCVPEGLLHGVLRLADHARADVVRIDTAAAAAVPGRRGACSPPPTSPASCGSG